TVNERVADLPALSVAVACTVPGSQPGAVHAVHVYVLVYGDGAVLSTSAPFVHGATNDGKVTLFTPVPPPSVAPIRTVNEPPKSLLNQCTVGLPLSVAWYWAPVPSTKPSNVVV